jgi:hypothetical protein
MIRGSRSFLTHLILLGASASLLVACASAATGKKAKKEPADPGDDFGWEQWETEPDPLVTSEDPDSGAFGAAARPKTSEAGPVDPVDAGPVTKTFCTGPLAAGDLAITELMITSRAGSGDDGEWVEITSTKDCWLTLQGVAIESPRGTSAPNTVTIEEPFELAPHGTFIVADSADPAKNHAVPGKVFSWAATDVLKNDGDAVTVRLGTVVLDAVTYPAYSNLTAGRTLAFPDDCAPTARSDWKRWSLTFTAWSQPGFMGTPNAANADVTCF